ncbi:YdcH family protein [Ramlibacter sp. MAHUQ-53]|uniref:YdcH family protein n=1 Tax=unclassified Ramlibacter TaxID=2617605 RepID=UPI00363DF65C
MFPEYRDLITTLKHRDQHFTRLFDRHNDLDQKIRNMEERIEPSALGEIEALKKEKLRIKDDLYALLKKAAGH